MSSGGTPGSMSVSLSGRELEIIELVAEGLTNQEIAERLTISKRTVDNHVSNVFTKTGSKNRVALLNWARITAKSAGMASTAVPFLTTGPTLLETRHRWPGHRQQRTT